MKKLMILLAWFLFHEAKAVNFPKTSLFELGFGTKKMTTGIFSERSYFKAGASLLEIKSKYHNRYFLVGTFLTYNSVKFTETSDKLEKFFGGGMFSRYIYESEFLGNMPIVLGADIGLSKELYFSGGVGFMIAQKIEVMVNFDFFDGQSQPTIGFTLGIKPK